MEGVLVMAWRNRSWAKWACLWLCLYLCLSVCACAQPAAQIRFDENQSKHQYSMQLELDEQGKLLIGKSVIQYRNDTGKTLVQVPFMLYPNAYKQADTAPFASEDLPIAYPSGFDAGYILIDTLHVDGQSTYYGLDNADDTCMQIHLPKPLLSGQTAQIEIGFTVKLPHSLGRFGYGEKAFNLCNATPIACAWDGEAFIRHPYGKVGDPFVSDLADYEVTLRVPQGMVVAHTGEGSSRNEAEDTVYEMRAQNVRDFAMVASRYFQVAEKQLKCGDTQVRVRSYYFEDCPWGGQFALETGVEALRSFTKQIAAYPYPVMNVVQTDFFIGGMEYPNLVLIDQSLYNQSLSVELDRVVAHEVGHQWFYGIVGNDQVREPWLDEALTDYVTRLYFYDRYGEAQGKAYEELYVTQLYDLLQQSCQLTEANDGVGQPATAFADEVAYSAVVYIRGTQMLCALERQIGREAMCAFLSDYVCTFAGQRVSGTQFLQHLNAFTGSDFATLLQQWL